MQRTLFALFLLIICLRAAQAQNNATDKWFVSACSNYDQYQWPEAIADFNKSIQAGYKVARSYSFKAYAEVSIQQYDQAEADLNAALAADSLESLAYHFKARLYVIKHGDLDTALWNSRKAISIEADIAEYFDAMAMIFLQKNMYDSALIYSGKAVSMEPDHPAYLHNLGSAKLMVNQFQSAINVLTKALPLAKDIDMASMIMERTAYGHYGLRQYKEALATCDLIIARNPGYLEAYATKARVCRSMHKYTEMCEALKTALSQDPCFESFVMLSREMGCR